MSPVLNQEFHDARRELAAYLCRLVIRPEVAEELVQTTYLRCLSSEERLPESAIGVRAWLFKVASNLAFDELRRHANWRENMLGDLRELAEASDDFSSRSALLSGTPETKAIAREHLVACMACVLRNLPERKAAAVLLKEVHGFGVEEIAGMLDASHAQVKNWLQEGRAYLADFYGSSCALLAKTGVCHQCVELDGFFAANHGTPLPHDSSMEARFAIAASLKQQSWGTWHRMMFELMQEFD